jgi:hypothetical protein
LHGLHVVVVVVVRGGRGVPPDDDDGSDNGTSKDDQGASMTPKNRRKGWCGHTSSWHHELVGPELQSVLQANRPQHAGGLHSGSKDSTAPDVQAQSKRRKSAHPERPAQHVDVWEPSSNASTAPRSSRETSTTQR